MYNIYTAGAGRQPFATEWREEAQLLLPDFNLINPFRGKEITQKCELYSPNEIVCRDLIDIQRSKLVLAEMLLDDYFYVGTSMEIMSAAHFYHIPVVLWTDKYKNHYWLRQLCVQIFPSLDECAEYIREFWSDIDE